MKRGFLIAAPVIIVTFLMFYFGIKVYNDRYEKFAGDGHVIARTSKSSTKKYFFEKNSKYKISDDKVQVEFDDKDSVNIPSKSFIHYSDGSISTFSRSAVLNFSDLNNKTYNYYNIYPETIFTKNGDNYSVNYLDKRIYFKNFLLKISNNHYMIVGPKLELEIGDSKKTITNSYLEVSYLEGNIIRLENQEVSYQNISNNVIVKIGNISIDFVDKNIYVGDKRKLSLGEITINSSDNITINKKDNSSLTNKNDDKNSKKDNDNEDGFKIKNHDKLPSVNNGIVDTDDGSDEEVIDNTARIKDAQFTVSDISVTANRLRASVSIEDKDGVLQGDMSVKIIDTATNKVVYENTIDGGTNSIDIESESLEPETNYILVVNSNYTKNNIEFNKDFVQKTFITDPIGINLDKNYISNDSLEVNINKALYSSVLGVKATLTDKNGSIVSTKDIDLVQGDNIVMFDKLDHNSKYSVTLSNFTYNDSVIANEFNMTKTFTTLKLKPNYGGTSFTLNKKDAKFEMLLKNVSDPDNGIVSYKYVVYDARRLAAGDETVVATINKTDGSSASLKVDGSDIQRGVPYVFKVIITFNDNEKEYEYTTNISDVMKLDGVEFPSISFDKEEVTFERIVGRIVIKDDGNTINLNDGTIINITYTDSTGVSKTITSSGNLSIPIDINGLRSNETYSIAVSTKVDLQDGNPVIDNCHIGTVTVKTEDPHPFKLNFDTSGSSGSKDMAFNIQARLTNYDESTELEANTLTGIQFNLYEGKGTKGVLKKSIKKVDYDLNAYSSTLRDDYYDKEFEINPVLFGLKNSDLTSEYYTIEVTGAYDYTDYHNNLPIKNGIVTVKTNGVVPDLPVDPENSIEVNPIRNKDMSTDLRKNDLQGDTIVGYKVRANYDNSKRYAKSITYQLHASDGTIISSKKYNVPPSGDIDYIEFYLDNGKESGEKINNFRRGEAYYFTYTANLDLDFDGNGETTYPTGDVTLKSLNVYPVKQKPVFKMYPSVSNASKYIWKYKYSDVDHALKNQELVAYLDNIAVSSNTISESNRYDELSFKVDKSGIFSIRGVYELINNDSDYILEHNITSQFYDGTVDPDFGNVNVFSDTNRVVFSFDDYENKIDLFNRISRVDIDFISSSKTITVNDLTINNGNIVVDYSRIEDLMGEKISTKLHIYYDSGIYGFESDGDYHVLQTLVGSSSDTAYYYLFNGDKHDFSVNAAGAFLSYKFDNNSNRLILYNKGNKSQVSYLGQTIDEYGINENYTYYSPKKLVESNITPKNNEFSFKSIIPSISLLDGDNNSSIEPLLVSANLKMRFYGIGKNRLKDNKIYIRLYKTNDDGTDNKFIDEFSYNVSDFDNNKSIEITDLFPDTNYFIRVYGDVLDGGDYVRRQLYDLDDQTTSKNYYFSTVSNVGISKINVTYSPESYNKRYIKINYNLDKIVGFSYIKYEIYKIVDDNPDNDVLINTKIDNDIVFKKRMTKLINLSDTGVVTGNRYRIRIKPYLTTTINGKNEDFPLQEAYYDYYFPKLYSPYVTVGHTFSDNSLTFRVNIRDYSRSIVDGTYSVEIFDSSNNNITPSEYVDKKFSVSSINKNFVVDDVSVGDKYVLVLHYNTNYDNSLNNSNAETRTYTTTIRNNEGINIGNVYADKDSTDNTLINLTFFDSSKLSEITNVRYSIYDSNGFSIDNEIGFSPTVMTSGSTTYYMFKLPGVISDSGIYFISLQFYKKNTIIDETTVEYHLIN